MTATASPAKEPAVFQAVVDCHILLSVQTGLLVTSDLLLPKSERTSIFFSRIASMF